MARNRAIGLEGRIPWHLPADLKFFKRTTLGHVIVMGRKTFDSLGKPLPGRENVVLSRQPLDVPGVRHAASPDEIVEPADGRKLFVIGGAEIYRLALPWVTKCYETVVHPAAPIRGDAFYPEAYLAQRSEWRCTTRESHSAQEKDECDYEYQVWETCLLDSRRSGEIS